MEKKYYYKAMNKDMKCWGTFQFKVGEIYTIESEEELELCSDKVFHFCKKLEDTINYYRDFSDRHFLIETLGDIITDENKSGSNNIRIVREISREEIEEHIQVETTDNAKEFLALYSSNIETLEILAKDGYWRVRSAIARNVNTPVYLLEDLAKDNDWEVRSAVAENPNTPVEILETLSKDKEWEVRSAVAENPNTSKRMFKKMAKDEDLDVRRAVAKNPNTPIDILEELVNDEILNVRWEAQERLKEITQ